MNPSDWHQRFKQQAGWSNSARQYCFSQINLPEQAKILEVGSGTGAIISEFSTPKKIFGIDLNQEYLSYSKHTIPSLNPTLGDGNILPFPDNSFDLVFCHYLLLWLPQPLAVLKEMFRVAKPGSWLACFAEPDYLARIDHPQALQELGNLQNQSLQSQGVCLDTGRQLTQWLSALNLTGIQSGILGGHWQQKFSEEEWALEWEMLNHDLQTNTNPVALTAFKNQDRQAAQSGSRVLFIPTFYAWGQKKAILPEKG